MTKLINIQFTCPGFGDVYLNTRSWHKAMTECKKRCKTHNFPFPEQYLKDTVKKSFEAKGQGAGYQWDHLGMTLKFRIYEYNKWSV